MADQAQSVLWFKQVGLADRLQVGGKGASLGELTRAGIAVPPGFVVPVSTFEAFLGAADPEGACRTAIEALDPGHLESLSAEADKIRQRIMQAPLPGHVAADIARAYREVCGVTADAPVAVRSSATSEDSEEASFAGLQDTYLWVSGETAVIEHVRRCWASLYNTESIAYRLRLKLPESQVAMAVVVQRMVLSRCAGVMFTRSPTTGDRSTIVIEGAWGFGSSLVSGEVTPDRFVVNKVTSEITSRTISPKLIYHVPDPSGGGVSVEPVPAERQTMPCLSDKDIAELTALGKRVEKHYGAPQDIEWAMTDEGGSPALYVLQSRPETVWAARDKEPIATAKSAAFDHVFAALGRKA